MNFKENCGVDPVTLGKGYTKLDGDPPHSGENILDPRHVQEQKRVEAMEEEYAWPDMKDEDDGPTGFLDRDKPTPWDRPQRGDTEDRG